MRFLLFVDCCFNNIVKYIHKWYGPERYSNGCEELLKFMSLVSCCLPLIVIGHYVGNFQKPMYITSLLSLVNYQIPFTILCIPYGIFIIRLNIAGLLSFAVSATMNIIPSATFGVLIPELM